MAKKANKSNAEGKNQRLYPRYKIGLKNIYVEHSGETFPIIDFSYGGLALHEAGSLPEECDVTLTFMKYKAFITLKKVYTSKKRSGFMIKHESKESLNQLSPIVDGLNASDKLLFVEDSFRADAFKGKGWIVLESVDSNELYFEIGDSDNIKSMMAIFLYDDRYKRIHWEQGGSLTVTQSDDRIGAGRTNIESVRDKQAALAFLIAMIIGSSKKHEEFKKQFVQGLHVIDSFFTEAPKEEEKGS